MEKPWQLSELFCILFSSPLFQISLHSSCSSSLAGERSWWETGIPRLGRQLPDLQGWGSEYRTSDCPDVTKERTMGKRVGEPANKWLLCLYSGKKKKSEVDQERPLPSKSLPILPRKPHTLVQLLYYTLKSNHSKIRFSSSPTELVIRHGRKSL